MVNRRRAEGVAFAARSWPTIEFGAVTARFRFHGDAVYQVSVAGTFSNWHPIPMQRRSKWLWGAALPLEAGHYEYRFIVDGVWQEDPKAAMRAPNGFGEWNSVLIIDSAERTRPCQEDHNRLTATSPAGTSGFCDC